MSDQDFGSLDEVSVDLQNQGKDRPQFEPEVAIKLNQKLLKRLGSGVISKVRARTLEVSADSDTLREVLSSDTKLIERAKSIPSKAVRAFMSAVGMSVDGWNQKLNQYLVRPGTVSSRDLRVKNTRKGNFARQAALRVMSWNVLERVFAIWETVDLQITFSFRLKGDPEGQRREFTIQVDDFQAHVDSMERLEYDFGVDNEQATSESRE